MNINVLDWLAEAEEPLARQAPTTEPMPNATVQQPLQGAEDNKKEKPSAADTADDVTEDPELPDLPDEEVEQKKKKRGFDEWRFDFLKLSIKSEVDEMLSAIRQIRSRKLEAPQRRFVEDNLQILLYRQDDNAAKACKAVRNAIKDSLDQTNPATSLMHHISSALENDIVLQQVLIKLSGYYGIKNELHRKFLGALMGAVQVGGGGVKHDIIYCGTDYTINFSTRFATQFGEINIGKWSLKKDDPQKYLAEPELDRLNNGSPEEKQVLRRRIIMEAIGERFKQRGFLIHLVHQDGTIHSVGWDMGDSLLAAYKDGKLVVRGKETTEHDISISHEGDIIPLMDLDIFFVTETGDTDDEGLPEQVEVPFLERKDGILYLCADLETLQKASSVIPGLFFREMPWGSTQEELNSIRQCIASLTELLSKRCFE